MYAFIVYRFSGIYIMQNTMVREGGGGQLGKKLGVRGKNEKGGKLH